MAFDRATLKSYFETGDQPTQAQFAAFIDAIGDEFQAMQAALDAALADLANAALFNPDKMLVCRLDAGAIIATYRSIGISSKAITTAGLVSTLTVNFDGNFPNLNFYPEISSSSAVGLVTSEKNAAYCKFTFPAGASGFFVIRFFHDDV